MPARDGPLVGRRVVEWSTMATAAMSGTKWAIYGDFFSGFFIVHRIGMSIEIVQNLFGANRRPTAERGMLAYWRTGSKVVVPEGLRYGRRCNGRGSASRTRVVRRSPTTTARSLSESVTWSRPDTPSRRPTRPSSRRSPRRPHTSSPKPQRRGGRARRHRRERSPSGSRRSRLNGGRLHPSSGREAPSSRSLPSLRAGARLPSGS